MYTREKEKERDREIGGGGRLYKIYVDLPFIWKRNIIIARLYKALYNEPQTDKKLSPI